MNAAIPDSSNFYGSLLAPLSKHAVANLFRAAGWRVHEPDDTAHLEVVCDWAELMIEAESPILLHGPVDLTDGNARKVTAVLDRAGITFTAEVYAEGGNLLEEWSSGTSPSPDPLFLHPPAGRLP